MIGWIGISNRERKKKRGTKIGCDCTKILGQLGLGSRGKGNTAQHTEYNTYTTSALALLTFLVAGKGLSTHSIFVWYDLYSRHRVRRIIPRIRADGRLEIHQNPSGCSDAAFRRMMRSDSAQASIRRFIL